jgi:hypothetical protein
VSAWVRFADALASPASTRLTLQRRCPQDSELGAFTALVTASVGAEWTLLQGTFEAPTCEPTALTVFIETVPEDMARADYYVDDVSLIAVP